MNNTTILIVVAILFFGYVIFNTFFSNHEAIVSKKKIYQYTAKKSVMTAAESEFFKILVEVASDRYYVFPQVHLSAILDHKVKGQTWKYAFGHINGKSVDYVLCDKLTLRPTYAVELDDKTHDRPDRIERDQEVERIFMGADIPLVRFSNYRTLSIQDIEQQFLDARSNKITQ